MILDELAILMNGQRELCLRLCNTINRLFQLKHMDYYTLFGCRYYAEIEHFSQVKLHNVRSSLVRIFWLCYYYFSHSIPNKLSLTGD